jgi:type II secretory pathway component PulC
MYKYIFAVLWCFAFIGSTGCRSSMSTAPVTPNMTEWNKWLSELNASSRDSLISVVAPPLHRDKTIHFTTEQLEKLLSELPSMVSLLEVELIERDGRTVGLAVGRISARDPLRTLGLNSRDIVVAIAGVHMTSIDAGKRAIEAARTALDRDGTVDVIRIDSGPPARIRPLRTIRTRFVAHQGAVKRPEWLEDLGENAQQFAAEKGFIEETVRLTPHQLDTYLDQLPTSMEQIRTTPVEHNQATIGIRLTGMKQSHPLSRLGMQRKDIVLSVADTPLDTPDAPKAAQAQSRRYAEQNTPIDVVVSRDEHLLRVRFVSEHRTLEWRDWMATLDQPLAEAIDALTIPKAPTPQEPIQVSKEWLEAALDTPPPWLSALTLEPKIADGLTIGLDTTGITEQLATRHLGLENAEVVVELGGVHITSPEALSRARDAIRRAIDTGSDIHLVILLRTQQPTAARIRIEVVNNEPQQPDCPVWKCWRAHPQDGDKPTASKPTTPIK